LKKRPILIGCLLVVLLCIGFVSAIIYWVAGLMAGMCGSELNQTAESPDGKYVAYVYTRDCGATTQYSHHLTVLKKGVDLDPADKGNVLITYGEISMAWKDATHLSVSKSGATHTFKEEKRYKGVTIQYP
jgi:hypothetical protein